MNGEDSAEHCEALARGTGAAAALTLSAQSLRHLRRHPVAVHGLHQALPLQHGESGMTPRDGVAAVAAAVVAGTLILCAAIVLADQQHCVLCAAVVLLGWLDLHAGRTLGMLRRITAALLAV